MAYRLTVRERAARQYRFVRAGFRYGFKFWFSEKYRHRIRNKRNRDKKVARLGAHGFRLYSNTSRRARRRIFGDNLYGVCAGPCHRVLPTNELTIDHITQVSKGGSITDPKNLQVLCYPCHIAKDGGGPVVQREWYKPFVSAFTKYTNASMTSDFNAQSE